MNEGQGKKEEKNLFDISILAFDIYIILWQCAAEKEGTTGRLFIKRNSEFTRLLGRVGAVLRLSVFTSEQFRDFREAKIFWPEALEI